jgi:antitoxin component YwqK of YwqJK toxin-antitoxin module
MARPEIDNLLFTRPLKKIMMIQKITLTALAFGFFACKNDPTPAPPSGPIEKTLVHPGSDKKSRQYTEVNGKIEGRMVEFYKTGERWKERFFVGGKEHGRSSIYYPSGKTKEVQYFDNGLQHNGDTTWYENGQVQFVVGFKNGQRDGALQKWDTTGTLFFEALYAQDSLVRVTKSSIQTKKK